MLTMEIKNEPILNTWKDYNINVQRRQVWLADLSGTEGSCQTAVRPVLILQNRFGNAYSPTVICAPISSSQTKKPLPTHVYLSARRSGLQRDSIVFLEQIRTIDKWSLIEKITELDEETMEEVNEAIKISLALN